MMKKKWEKWGNGLNLQQIKILPKKIMKTIMKVMNLIGFLKKALKILYKKPKILMIILSMKKKRSNKKLFCNKIEKNKK